ncbi:hypothetical protein TRFO_19544 [Tritrichomonas foetus]|uniref:SNF7 family protein n=1 Tax=Tritrichomonas foetus TaxID=1144522 RepID=A0A1J4KMP6_9EUKA|nr:hypothetical protein TRFO_19544 [Tritrichomonas foetus]|eukprot:OHT10966.1 hypothetical protein TRFO_19544 [Tritrichomonas foetus]
MTLRSTFKQHVTDDVNPLLDTTAKMQQRIKTLQNDLANIMQRISNEMAEFKATTSETRKRDIKKKVMLLIRRQKIYEKQLAFFDSQLFNIDQLTFGAQLENESFANDDQQHPLTRSELTAVLVDGNSNNFNQTILVQELNSINDLMSELDPLPENDDLYQLDFKELEKEFLVTPIPLDEHLTEYDESVLTA